MICSLTQECADTKQIGFSKTMCNTKVTASASSDTTTHTHQLGQMQCIQPHRASGSAAKCGAEQGFCSVARCRTGSSALKSCAERAVLEAGVGENGEFWTEGGWRQGGFARMRLAGAVLRAGAVHAIPRHRPCRHGQHPRQRPHAEHKALHGTRALVAPAPAP